MLDFADPPQLVTEIVFTGGSCAGKTSALGLVSRSLREKGHAVLTCPEAVTLLVTAGIPKFGDISRNDLQRACLFQHEVYAVQRQLRETMRALAGMFMAPQVVILYDRGELDATAYHPHDCLHEYAAADGLTLPQIRDTYTAVMHLVTAADGAVEAYSANTNPARWDTPDEACRFDQKILTAWEGHPRHHVIDNSTDFIGKMEKLVEATLKVINEQAAPTALRIETSATA